MHIRNSLSLLFLSRLLPLVLSCEGECIIGISDAFHKLYSPKVHDVLVNLEKQIIEKLLPPSKRYANEHDLYFLYPIEEAYSARASSSLQDDIFPSYFHGKCQRFSSDGRDPPGCPNPDCPVVCGTPGSLVHFYNELRFIAFNSTRTLLHKVLSSDSDAYKNTSMRIRAAAGHGARAWVAKRDGIGSILDPLSGLNGESGGSDEPSFPQDTTTDSPPFPISTNTVAPVPQETHDRKGPPARTHAEHFHNAHTSKIISKHKHQVNAKHRSEAIVSRPSRTTHVHHNARALPSVTHTRIHARQFGSRTALLSQLVNRTPTHEGLRSANSQTPALEQIFSPASEMLANECGGNVGKENNSLSECSWEKEMKAYILSFP